MYFTNIFNCKRVVCMIFPEFPRFQGYEKDVKRYWSRSVKEFGCQLCSGPVWWRKRLSANISKYVRDGGVQIQIESLNSCSLMAARLQRSDFDIVLNVYIYTYISYIYIYMYRYA